MKEKACPACWSRFCENGILRRYCMRWMSRKEVLDALFEKWNDMTDAEMVPLSDSLGRILAEDVYSLWTIPVVRASNMDGVAVKSSAFRSGMPDTGNWVRGVDYERADTGDDFDDAFDAVIAIEQVEILSGGGIRIDPAEKVAAGYNVRPAGSSLKKDEQMLYRGTRIRPEHIACAAMAGRDELLVYKKPLVAFIPTGSELVPAGAAVGRGQNIDSNSPMAEAMIREMGGQTLLYPIIKDNRNELESVLEDALGRADIVVLSGGSSRGEEDFNTHILKERGELICDGVAAVPGRPMSLAMVDGKPVMNSPGPPAAAFYGLDWCVRAMICRMTGVPMTERYRVQAKLTKDLHSPENMEKLTKLNVYRTKNGFVAEPLLRGSSRMADRFNASGLMISTPGIGFLPAGSVVEVELLCTPDRIPWAEH